MKYDESKKRKNRVTLLFTDEEYEGLQEYLESSEYTSLSKLIRNALSDFVNGIEKFERLSNLLKEDSYRGGRPKGSTNKKVLLERMLESISNKDKSVEDLFDYDKEK